MNELKQLLKGAVRDVCGSESMGLIFSAGIDSTLIGMVASSFSNVTGYAVGIKGSSDVEHAKAAVDLGFSVEIVEIDMADVAAALPVVLGAIKEPNPLKVAVGVPFYFASKKASEDGIEVMLCGQGSDEMFGGYNRYVEAIPTGMKKVGQMMKEDVEGIFERQLQYDSRICDLSGIELRFPYMDENFVDYVMSIPVDEKIKRVENNPEYSCVDTVNGDRYIRKYVLRKLAAEFNVPKDIINRPKKAAQYGSGTQRVIDRLAKAQGYKEKARNLGRKDYKRLYVEELYAGLTH